MCILYNHFKYYFTYFYIATKLVQYFKPTIIIFFILYKFYYYKITIHFLDLKYNNSGHFNGNPFVINCKFYFNSYIARTLIKQWFTRFL